MKAMPKAWPVAKEKEEDASPQKPRVAPAGRFAHPSRGGRGSAPNTAHQREKRCFNCDEVGHFSRDCPKSPRVKEFVRAARTVSGGNDADEMEDEDPGHPSHYQDDRASLEGSSSKTLEIEVAAEDFYETTDADPDFVASMYTFPLSGKGTKEVTTGPSWLASGETMP
jgi:hypothetical protein